jgi:hypothetical protein
MFGDNNMFEKTLTDVVKGIRSSKRDTALYISQCIAEIKTEIGSTDIHVKANALQKLTFLQMMGYSMSWASFASIEVMSSQRFDHKRIGYLAAVRTVAAPRAIWRLHIESHPTLACYALRVDYPQNRAKGFIRALK